MRIMKLAAVAAGLSGAVLLSPSASGQSRPAPERRPRELTILAGRGGELGVRIADAESGGVRVEEVDAGGAAEKAGIKRGDIIVEFDGEHVRSSRQLARIVQETPLGRGVKATITRDGRKQDIQVTLEEGRGTRGTVMLGDGRVFDDNRFRQEFGDLGRFWNLPFNYNFNFDLPGMMSGSRLGVTVNELTSQLAEHFGVRDGVLVTSVTDGSAASRAGIKAGDVITSINGSIVKSAADLVRSIREGENEELSIGLVRERKEMTVKAKIEPRRPARNARPV